MDILILLERSGHLKLTNYDVIIDMINLTGTQGVVSCNELLKNAHRSFGETLFSSYRQKLAKFGSTLWQDDTKILADLTGILLKEHHQRSTLILDLENREIISEDNLPEFIQLLRENNINHAAKVLEELSKDFQEKRDEDIEEETQPKPEDVSKSFQEEMSAVDKDVEEKTQPKPEEHEAKEALSTTDISSRMLSKNLTESAAQDLRFETFRKEFIRTYTGSSSTHLLWLRFLLYVYLSPSQLSDKDVTEAILINEIFSQGIVTYNNVRILSEIAELTYLQSVKQCIHKYKEDNQCSEKEEGTGLTNYRKTLFKALREVANEEIYHISAYYQLEYEEFHNIWDVVFKLENEVFLDNTKEKWERFASLLNARARGLMMEHTAKEVSTDMSSGMLSEGLTNKTVAQEQRFRDFLLELSRQYRGTKFCWLRFLLYDYLPISFLQYNNTTMGLFNEMARRGFISYENVKILSEIVELTVDKSAEVCVCKYKESNECNEQKGTGLTIYRKTLFRALNEVKNEEITELINYYKLQMNPDLKNIWDVVFNLENKVFFENEKKKWEQFARILNPQARRLMMEAYQLKTVPVVLMENISDLLNSSHIWHKLARKLDYSDEYISTIAFHSSPALCILIGWFERGWSLEYLKRCLADMNHEDIVKFIEEHLAFDPEKSLVESSGNGIMVDGNGSYIRDEDTELYIYTGAVKEGKRVFISLENSPDIDEPNYCDNESRVSRIVKCGPTGAKFDIPCLLSFPHYAIQEESWEFKLMVKKGKFDAWIQLEADDKNTSFTVQNGRCYVKTNHFCWYMLIILMPGGINEEEKVLNLGFFGKMLHNNKYKLTVRTWSDEKTKEVEQEQQRWKEYPLEKPSKILVTFKDMDIKIHTANGWHVEKNKNVEFKAKLLHTSCPWGVFLLRIDDEKKEDQEATIELSQGGVLVHSVIIPEIKVKCPGIVFPQIKSKNKEENFREFLKEIGDMYPHVEKYRWLRLLLYDHINIGILSRKDIIAQGLFNCLEDEGNISYTNVTILEEISKLTKQTQAIAIVDKYKKLNRCHTDRSKKLAPFRKALFRTLTEVTCGDLQKLVYYYKVDKYDNIWDLVFFLEIEKKLTLEKIQYFTGNLNEKAQGTFIDYWIETSGDTDIDSGQYYNA